MERCEEFEKSILAMQDELTKKQWVHSDALDEAYRKLKHRLR